MTKEDVIRLLRDLQGPRTQREYAQVLGVSESYLSAILVGRNEPGPSVLRAIGYKRVVLYELDNEGGTASE